MASLMLVANPAASQFTGGDHRAILTVLGRNHQVEAVWPSSAAGARDIAADAVTAGFDGVIAMGGDGIVHQVAQALVGTDVFLAVVPSGTTNVFARQIGLPARPVRAARILAGRPRVRQMPVVTVEATLPEGNTVSRHAVFAVGVGMDADVVAAAETEPYRKYRFGSVHYLRTALGLLWSDVRRRQPTIAVREGTRATSVIGALVQFHSAFTYFGPRPLRFGQEGPDPMTVALVERLTLRRMPALAGRLVAGAPLEINGAVAVWEHVKAFDVAADPPARFEIDGEVIGELVDATVTFRPEALWVAAPG